LNVKLIKADAASTGLASRMADCCLLAFILHEVKRPAALIGEACRLLKPGGRLVVLEWKAEEGTPGPPLKIRLSGAQARQLLEDAGLTGPAYLDWSRHHYVVTGRQV
jgi:ubiquinone/menaquinone biosynthesis C-methylase UbiE